MKIYPASSGVVSFPSHRSHRNHYHQIQRYMSSWWNPLKWGGNHSAKGGNHNNGDMNAIMSSARTKSQNESEAPRKLQERKDLTLLMLATEFRKISFQKDRERQSMSSVDDNTASNAAGTSTKTTDDAYLETREELIDMAFEKLSDIDVDAKSLMHLRLTLQSSLEEQVIDCMNLFRLIDDELLLLASSDESDDAHNKNTNKIELFMDEILRLELERTIDDMANTIPKKAPKGANPEEFLALKRNAIETVLGCDGTRQSEREQINKKSTKVKAGCTNIDASWSQVDEFGYHLSVDQERNRLIRYYQKINVCRAAKMRDSIGYSVLALQSSIPGAGRGVYVDGYARAGSILVFQPGKVFSKENLVSLSVDEERELERNDSYQMSLRPDDFVIDSRKSSYTVLTDDNSNLMAIGHIVNHPTPTKRPNARSAMFNFTQSMQLGASLKRYIPNTYAKPRTRTFMGSLLDQDVVDMHSMVLVATRDICNEEIFYNYRLATSHLPNWYQPVIENDYVPEYKVEESNEKVD